MVKNLPASAGNIKEAGSIPGSEDPLEKGRAILASILAWRIPMDRGAWWAAVHGVAKSRDMTERLHSNKISDSLCCRAETNPAWSSNSTPIKINLKKEMDVLPPYGKMFPLANRKGKKKGMMLKSSLHRWSCY